MGPLPIEEVDGVHARASEQGSLISNREDRVRGKQKKQIGRTKVKSESSTSTDSTESDTSSEGQEVPSSIFEVAPSVNCPACDRQFARGPVRMGSYVALKIIQGRVDFH